MQCSKCGKEGDPGVFATYKDRNGLTRRRGICKVCRGKRALDKFEELQQWRKNYNARNRTKKAERSAKVRAETKAYIDEAKSKPCIDCGGTFPPVCMDFDHANGGKTKGIARMYSSCYKLDLIKDEIAKCELVCSNCHRIRTATRKENLSPPS